MKKSEINFGRLTLIMTIFFVSTIILITNSVQAQQYEENEIHVKISGVELRIVESIGGEIELFFIDHNVNEEMHFTATIDGKGNDVLNWGVTMVNTAFDSLLFMAKEDYVRSLNHYHTSDVKSRHSVYSQIREWDIYASPNYMVGKFIPACALGFYVNTKKNNFHFVASEENTEARCFGSGDPFWLYEKGFWVDLDLGEFVFKANVLNYKDSKLGLLTSIQNFQEQIKSVTKKAINQ